MDLTQDAESQSEEAVADPEQLHQELLEFSNKFKDSISQVIIGQQEILDQLVVALFCRGHVLITGVPGLAKTLLIRSLAQLFHLKFNRIQCTPDLMPSDITGVEILEESGTDRSFRFIPGPVFTNLLLADEINRTSPRTQAALLQAMQEQEVTVSGQTRTLEDPFIVFATQNPIDSEGTYPLPEAQLDRFLFNIDIRYPAEAEEIEIAKLPSTFDASSLEPIFEPELISRFQTWSTPCRWGATWLSGWYILSVKQGPSRADSRRFRNWWNGAQGSELPRTSFVPRGRGRFWREVPRSALNTSGRSCFRSFAIGSSSIFPRRQSNGQPTA